MADLNALLVFAGVAEAGSFSAAARRLGMPVSTVSRQVAVLEDELGVRLIKRSTRSLRLTDAGTRILEQARRGLEVSEAVDRLAAEQAAGVTGLLRLSAPPGIAETLLAPVAAAFAEAYPDVRLQASVCDPPGNDPVAWADLAFRSGALKNSSLVALRVLRYRRRLVASPGYLARHRMPTRPSDLAGHRVLTLLDGSPDRRWSFVRAGGDGRDTVHVRPHLATGRWTMVADTARLHEQHRTRAAEPRPGGKGDPLLLGREDDGAHTVGGVHELDQAGVPGIRHIGRLRHAGLPEGVEDVERPIRRNGASGNLWGSIHLKLSGTASEAGMPAWSHVASVARAAHFEIGYIGLCHLGYPMPCDGP